MDHPTPAKTEERPSVVLRRDLQGDKGVGELDLLADLSPLDMDLELSGDEFLSSLDLSFGNEAQKRPRDSSSKDADDKDEPKKKKQRLKKKKIMIPSITWPEDDFENDATPALADAPPQHKDPPSLGLFDDDDDLLDPMETDSKSAAVSSVPRITEIKRVMHEGLPLLTQTFRSVYCRCVFSATLGKRTSFDVIDKCVSVPYNFSQQKWAVMATCAGPDGMGSGHIDGSSLSRRDERGNKPPAEAGVETQWFILVGDAALNYICSPFFTYQLSIVQFDPDAVLFRLNPTAPIYRLFAVLDKIPMFSGGSDKWDAQPVIKALQDTLYAHALLRPGSEEIEKILCAIDNFEQADEPHEKSLPGKRVALNAFSDRKERSKHLREIIGKPSKKAFEGVDPVQGNRASALAVCINLKGLQSVLFYDLEKPKLAFQLLGAGVSLQEISEMSSWRDASSAKVQKKVNAILDSLSYKREGQSKHFPGHIARDIRLDPDWFARYYQWLRDKRSDCDLFNKRESRLAAYRTFIASDLYHDVKTSILKYRNHICFLFTKRQREKYFESDNFRFSELDVQERKFCGGDLHAPGRNALLELSGEEKTQLKESALILLEKFGVGDPNDRESGKFKVLRNQNQPMAISLEYSDTMNQLAQFFVQICNTWVDAAESSVLPKAYRQQAPVVSQFTFVYSGKHRHKDRERILTVLNDAASDRMRVVLIGVGEDRAKMQQKVLSAGHKKYVVLVLDELHNWRLEQLKSLAYTARSLGKASRVTHLVTLSHANTLSKSVGANVAWDLTDIGLRIQQMALPGVEAPSLLDLPALPFRWVPAGERSAMMFTEPQRIEQLEYNHDVLVFSQERSEPKSRDNKAVQEALRTIPSNAGPNTVVVLYARNATQDRIRSWVQRAKSALLRETNPAVIFVNYAKLEELSSSFPSIKLAIVADLKYDGPAQPSFQHFNALLERTSECVLVLGSRDNFKRIYLSNGTHTDRHTYHLNRLPYLKEKLDSKLFDSTTSRLVLFKDD